MAMIVGLLFLLSVGLSKQAVDGCTCEPGHPQKLYCNSDIVMHAEITGEKIIPNDENIPGMGTIQYELKVIKVFKGFDRMNDIKYVNTYEMSSLCGTRLHHGQYLLSGEFIRPDGFVITLCNFVEHWDKLSSMLKYNLQYIYKMGCNCKISNPSDRPIHSRTNDGCILTDWKHLWPPEDGEQAHEYACIKHKNGSCNWYKEMSNHKDTIDMSDI
ncbi:metalloproteinase inhibitor 2 [Xyrauchen texanus]|uniref:metalloproteinase inhibitor 2 n=1 Tax=Xyrauchen texanus TaxID=154827 RepID=UPI0022428CE4|nr:metalloproteinase inhibitor 2 [Xyrauchen texanus]